MNLSPILSVLDGLKKERVITIESLLDPGLAERKVFRNHFKRQANELWPAKTIHLTCALVSIQDDSAVRIENHDGVMRVLKQPAIIPFRLPQRLFGSFALCNV